MMTSSGFLPHMLQPTRISEQSSTIIDNIYGNNLEQEIISGNILIQFADHLSQFSSIKKKIMRTKHSPVYRRNFSAYNEQSYIDDVSIQNWDANNLQGTNTKFNDFVWRLESCVVRHVPIKKLNKKQINKTLKPWITKTILKMISHKDRLFHKKDNPLVIRIKNAYNLFRNRITRETRKAKKEYCKNYFENNISNMKNTWKGIKNILSLGNKNHSQITQTIKENLSALTLKLLMLLMTFSLMLGLNWMS